MAESRWVTITIASLLWSISLVRGQVNVTFDSVVVVDETVGNFNICLNLNDSLTNNTIINIAVDHSSQAKNGTDFIIPSEVGLEENTLKVCINVSIINDNVIERSNESALIIFSSDDDSELIFEHNSTQLIIISLDELDVTVDNMNRNVNEGDTLRLCANLSSSNYEFSFNVTATAIENMTANSNDISSFTSQSLEFMPPNNSSCISINISNTDSLEGDEMFEIEWSLSGAPPNVRITPPTSTVITIESQLILSLVNDTTITVTEGDTFYLCIMSNGLIGSATVSINFTFTGDTTNVTPDPKDLITFKNGTQQQCIKVTTSDNSIIEPSKVVTFTFFNSIGANFNGSNIITVTIEDNSTAVVGFNTTTNSVKENSTFQPQLITFEGQININFTINIIAVNDTAKAGIDFNFTGNNPYIWSVKSPPVILIDILSNDIVEGDKRFSLNLIVNSNFITTNTPNFNVTIVDNDMSILSIPKSEDVSESAGSVMLCFTPSLQIAPKPNGSNYILYYRTEDDKAMAGRDYTPVSKGQVDIPSRSTSRQCISINITHNNMMEGQRNFFVNWFLESGILPGVILENNVTNVTINDDDITPLPSSSPPSTPSPPSSASTSTPGTSSGFPLLVIVGVIVGVVLACLLFFIVLIIVILCVKMRTNRQGFYTTYEDKGDAPQMLRYSASLRSLQSQTVMPTDPRDKENEYMV